MLETCVQPWQLATGQPIARGDASHLSRLTTLSVSTTFDYSVHHIQVFIALMAAIWFLKNGTSAGSETPPLDPAFVFDQQDAQARRPPAPGLRARTSGGTALKKIILVPGR